MSYSTDFYVAKKDGTLSFMFTVSGSDAPWHFEDAKTLSDVYDTVGEISAGHEAHVWYNWINPWENSKTSDDCVIFEMIDVKNWQFWKEKDSIKLWKSTRYKSKELNGTTDMYFVDDLSMSYGSYEDFDPSRTKLFTLPNLKKI